MATKILVAKKNGVLVAGDPWAAEAIDEMKSGEFFMVTLTQPRNVKFHRKFFAFLNLIFQNQSKYVQLEDLLEAMKECVGHGHYVDRLDGRGNFFKSKSISFAKMDEPKFRKFYDAFVSVVVTHIMPGIDKDDLLKEVEAHLV